MRIKFLFFVLMFLVFVSGIEAYNLTPGKTTIDFESGVERTVTLKVLNDGGKELNLDVYAEGELKEAIVLSEQSLHFLNGELEKEFSYVVKMPEELSEGKHQAIIVFEDEFVGVESELTIDVPYLENLLEINIAAYDLEENSLASFYVSLINRGKDILEEGRANIEIYDFENKKVAGFDLGPINLYPDKKAQLKSEWMVAVQKGEYTAKLKFKAGDYEKVVEQKFEIITPPLSIESVSVDYVNENLVKLTFSVLNKLEEDLPSVSMGIELLDSFGKVITQSKSLSGEINQLSTNKLIVYFNTEDLKDGTYDANVLIIRGENTKREAVRLEVKSGKVEIVRGEIGFSPMSLLKPRNVLIALIVALVIINVVWLLIRIRRRKKRFY